MKWGERELYVDGEIKVFKSNRGYGELIERMNIERVSNIVDLPCCENLSLIHI